MSSLSSYSIPISPLLLLFSYRSLLTVIQSFGFLFETVLLLCSCSVFDTVCSSAPFSSLHSQFSLNFLPFQDLIGYYMRWFVQSAAHSCLLCCSLCTASVSLFLHSNIPCMVRFASIQANIRALLCLFSPLQLPLLLPFPPFAPLDYRSQTAAAFSNKQSLIESKKQAIRGKVNSHGHTKSKFRNCETR